MFFFCLFIIIIIVCSASVDGHLRSLKLSNTHITDCGLGTIISQPQYHLRELGLAFCKEITDNGIGQLADSGQMSNLITLDLCGCVQLSDDALGHIAKGFDRYSESRRLQRLPYFFL